MSAYKILLVEDEENVLLPFAKQLREEGYQVDCAEDGQVALGKWEQGIYDVIVVDLRLPLLDGQELIRIIKEKQPATQIIILSGQGEEEDLIRAVNQHVFAYFKKPVDLEPFILAVHNAIQERDQLLLTLERLAEQAPEKEFLLVGQKSYTPQQIYDEVRKGSEVGKKLRVDFERSLTDFQIHADTIDEMLDFKSII